MINIPFLSKKEEETIKPEMKKESEEKEAEKKIEFSQKLSNEDLEGKVAPKGSDFNFFKREEAKRKEKKEEGAETEETVKKGRWWERLKNLKIGGDVGGIKTEKNFLEVNLIKGEIVKYFDWQKGGFLLMISVFAAVAFLSTAYWGISWWGSSQQYVQDRVFLQDYYRVDKEITDLAPSFNEILLLKDKIDLATYLLDRHVYWTNFFSFLEDNTLSNVYFSGFSGDTGGEYSLEATTNSIDAVDVQIKNFLANKYVTKAEVGGISIGGDKGTPVIGFSLSFSLDKKIFLK